VLVEALLFIENRDLLDPAHPKHNPAVDWGRLARVAFGQALRQVTRWRRARRRQHAGDADRSSATPPAAAHTIPTTSSTR
jgi:hypothetical protein